MADVDDREPAVDLGANAREMHHALLSLVEELGAIDAYNRRADACGDAALKAILEHNRDEEKEHACMLLEWIRRHDPGFSACIAELLFSESGMAHD